MANPSNLNDTIQRILNGTQTDSDVEALRQWLNSGGIQNLQVGKYNVNIGQGQDIHIGDRTYYGAEAEAIKEALRLLLQEKQKAERPRNEKLLLQTVKDEVVARLKQSLHNAVLINLGKEAQPEQVKRPWSSDIKIGDKPSEPIPDDRSILEVFDQEEIAGKLLILGNPGAGKTTTMLDLAKALIAQAEQDADYPIPVLFNLSTWKDDKQSMRDWLVVELKSKYRVRKDIGAIWVDDAKLLPMLDGLDELESVRQEPCVRKINEFLQSDRCPHLVVCSRGEEYEKVVRGQWQQDVEPESEEISPRQEIRLHLNGAILLQPLTDEQIQAYLARLNQTEIWETLQIDTELLMFVRTPLFLSILGFILYYQALSLQEWKTLTSGKARLEYLLDAYWEVAIRRKLVTQKMELKGLKSRTYGKKNFPSTRQTRKWLICLAQQLQRESQTELLLETIQPQWLDNSQLDKYICGLKIALFIMTAPLSFFFLGSLYNLIFLCLLHLISVIFIFCINFVFHTSLPYAEMDKNPWANWAVNFISFWLSGKLFYKRFVPILLEQRWSKERQEKILPIENLRFSWKYLWLKVRQTGKSYYELFQTPKIAIYIMLVSIFFHCWVPKYPVNFKSVSYPNKLMYESFLNCLKLSAFTSIAFSSFFTLFIFGVSLLSKPITIPFENLLISFIYCVLFFSLLVAPAVVIMSESGFACIQHFTLRLILYRNGYIPWNYSRFLDYCTERVLLQRVGGRYRFIHRLLQEHFAAMLLEK